MRFIPLRAHAVLDYLVAGLLMFGPWLLPLPPELRWMVAGLGAGTLVYSLCTDYELGVVRVLPVPAHLVLDLLGGVVLIALAIWGGAARGPSIVLGALGVFEVMASLLTRTAAMDSGAGPIGMEAPAMPQADGPSTEAGRPVSPVPADQVANVEQLRRAIDSGAMGDKVAMTDPAMVPLGGDDEAGDLHDEQGLATARRMSGRGK